MIILLTFSCSNNEIKDSSLFDFKCDNFYATGKVKLSSYNFCGIIPQKTDYTYKVGEWKFWNLSGQLIAQGVFKTKEKEINGQGGCSYKILLNKINQNEWKFWNNQGKEIKLTKENLSKFENCQIKHFSREN